VSRLRRNALMGVVEGLVNEADFGTWFISERLRDGSHVFLAGMLLNAPTACYLYTFVVLSC
jgi:hypothetical protein